jgi:hypothetical protein
MVEIKDAKIRFATVDAATLDQNRIGHLDVSGLPR